MAIKKYKPTTNGRRNMTGSDFAEITTSTPEKTLLQPLDRSSKAANDVAFIKCVIYILLLEIFI